MTSMISKTPARGLLAAAFGAVVLVSAPAFAGECPKDQVMTGARSAGETAAKELTTDTVISSVDLSGKCEPFKDYLLRMRKLVIQPGGVVPWHMHDVRAANILILEGTIIEYSSTCKVGIEHNAGDVVAEFGPEIAHWWRNEGTTPVVIISADLLPPAMPAEETM